MDSFNHPNNFSNGELLNFGINLGTNIYPFGGFVGGYNKPSWLGLFNIGNIFYAFGFTIRDFNFNDGTCTTGFQFITAKNTYAITFYIDIKHQ